MSSILRMCKLFRNAAIVAAVYCEEKVSKRKKLKWEEAWMGFAMTAAQMSSDEKMQVGACLVSEDGRIMSIGYNGNPRGSTLKWDEKTKHDTVCHAEMNAIAHAEGSTKNATMFTTLYPCNECAKIIVQSKIRYVIYLEKKESKNIKTEAAKKIFESTGTIVKPFNQHMVEKYKEPFCEHFQSKRASLNFTTWDYNKNKRIDF